jgi:predicted DNA-binding helix-hairpin-helix protein
MDTRRKLIILADAAKYNASCASSGTARPAASPRFAPAGQSTQKLARALANPAQFPIYLNHAPRERRLRVPGLGMRSVERLLLARRADLDRLKLPVAKVLPFVALPHHLPKDGDSAPLRRQVRPRADGAAGAFASRERQADLFS